MSHIDLKFYFSPPFFLSSLAALHLPLRNPHSLSLPLDALPVLPLFRQEMPLYPTRRLFLLFLISLLTLLALFYFSPSSQPLRLYPYPISRALPILDYSQISAKDYLSQRFKLLAAHQPLDYERSLEAETARCPHTHLQSNQDQLEGDGQEFWKRVSVEELVEARQKVIDRVKETVHQRGVGELIGNGQRGLVFTAGK